MASEMAFEARAGGWTNRLAASIIDFASQGEYFFS